MITRLDEAPPRASEAKGPVRLVVRGGDRPLDGLHELAVPGRVLAVLLTQPEAAPLRGGRRALALATVVQLADLHTLVRAARMRRALRRAGLRVWGLETGDRRRPHRLSLRRRPLFRPGRHPIILAAAPPAPPTVLEAALDAAGETLRRELVRGRMRVLSSGALLAEVAATGSRPLLLRLAGGAAAHSLAVAARNVETLARAAPTAVTERLAVPLASGELGPVTWVLEPRLDGHVPSRTGARLHGACLSFLGALWASPAEGCAEAAAPVPDAWARADAAVLVPHLAGARRLVLERVCEALAARLGEVPRGWCHGDFWPGNVLSRGGALTGVVDWDAAEEDGLPLLDLFHLEAHTRGAWRRVPHGSRCRDHLWPLARAGGDQVIREHCRATGLANDPDQLEALAVAYWLRRTARDLATFADRPERRDWMTANLEEPLDALGRGGW
jgi:aminoglycoside phosphotransferase (APT) family kinase protein